MRHLRDRWPAVLALAMGITLCLAGCGGPSAPTSGSSASPVFSTAAPIPVVAAENMYGDVLRQVCGSRCAVTSILSDPNADPHEYESDAQAAAAVADAGLVVENGVGYDSFMDHLLSASPNPRRRVISVQKLLGVPDGANPHLWYDPATMPKVATAAAEALGQIDTTHAADYASRAHTFIGSLQPLQAEIAAIKAAHPSAPVAYTESVFGYMGVALGLKVLTPEAFQKAIADGGDPPVGALAAEQDLLDQRRVKVLVYNSQAVTPVTTRIKNLATSDGVPVVGVSETEPPNTTYQQWMLDQLQQLAAALGGGASAGGQ